MATPDNRPTQQQEQAAHHREQLVTAQASATVQHAGHPGDASECGSALCRAQQQALRTARLVVEEDAAAERADRESLAQQRAALSRRAA